MTDENISDYSKARSRNGGNYERHIQSALLGVISILLSLNLWMLNRMATKMDRIEDVQSTQGATISALVERQDNQSDRLDFLSGDRYTGTEAAQDQLDVNRDINSIRAQIQDHGSRLRALENEWARYEGEQGRDR